ncbi:MAG: O-antigen ligase family protein [Bacteroidales bacterium]|nr:O-antigen ligase family protein [Bacteroidales bacterium]
MVKKQKTISKAAVAFVCCLLSIQLFPPLLVLDSSSLRHFLIALFDISALGFVLHYTIKYKANILSRSVFSNSLMIVWGVLLAFMGVSMLWTMNPIEGLAVWNRWIVVLLASVLCSAFLLYENKTLKALIVTTIVIAIINVLSCIIFYYVFDVHISQRNNLKLNGFYGNKNIFAVAFLFKLPFLYYAFMRYKGFIKWISLVLVFMIAFCLVILSTRSSFIGLIFHAVILLVYGVYSTLKVNRSKKAILGFVLPLLAIGCGFFSGNRFIEYNYEHFATKKVKNNYSVDERFKSIADGNSKGRLLIWKNTVEIIKEKPLSGYGVGNHKLAIMKVECAKKHDYIVSDHAHNDFLEMFSELGIFGCLIYVLTYVFAAIYALKQMFAKGVNELFRLRAMVGGTIILTYMNDAMFNFPLERADCQIYLAIGLALLISNHIKIKKNQKEGLSKPCLVTLLVIVVPVFILETTHCYSSIMQKHRIKQHNGDKSITLTAEQWDRRTPKFPNIDESTHPRAVNIAERYANEKKYRQAIDVLLADNSNPYYSLREYRLANYYNRIEKADSAAYWAEKCIAMKPLCYSPVRILVSIAGKEGKRDKQLCLIDEYLKRYEKEPLAWEDKISVLRYEKRLQEAIETCNQAIELFSKNAKFRSLKEKIIEEIEK